MIHVCSGEQKCQNGPENQMISKLCLENRNFFLDSLVKLWDLLRVLQENIYKIWKLLNIILDISIHRSTNFNNSVGQITCIFVPELISSPWIKPNPSYVLKCEYIFYNF